MAKKRVKAFVSHSWQHHAAYFERLCEMLQRSEISHFSILSIENHSPVFLANSGVARNIKEQIRTANVFLVFDTPAVSHSDWLRFEVETAASMKKPIVAIWPHGHTGAQRMSKYLEEYVTSYTAWNTSSILNTIELALLPDCND